MSSRTSYTLSQGADANLSRRPAGNFERDVGSTTIKGTGISFTNPATIADSNNGLGLYGVNDTIDVRGSAGNSRRWVVASTGAGSITVQTAFAQITTEGAGPTITIDRDS